RVMPNIVSAEHLGLAQSFKQLLARYRENKDLIAIGAYTKGSDPLTDVAVDLIPKLRAYIAQGITQGSVFTACKKELETLLQATQVADTAPVGTAKAAAAAATPATSNPTQAPRRASKVKRGLA
nr:hypothetical protein [Cellvibrionaceae bacterium]